jgi:hypothetical protein
MHPPMRSVGIRALPRQTRFWKARCLILRLRPHALPPMQIHCRAGTMSLLRQRLGTLWTLAPSSRRSTTTPAWTMQCQCFPPLLQLQKLPAPRRLPLPMCRPTRPRSRPRSTGSPDTGPSNQHCRADSCHRRGYPLDAREPLRLATNHSPPQATSTTASAAHRCLDPWRFLEASAAQTLPHVGATPRPPWPTRLPRRQRQCIAHTCKSSAPSASSG